MLLIKVNKNLKKLRKELKCRREVPVREYNPEDWALMGEVLKKLSISKSTLYRYRQQKKVQWVQKGGLSYYYLPDLIKLKFECMK